MWGSNTPLVTEEVVQTTWRVRGDFSPFRSETVTLAHHLRIKPPSGLNRAEMSQWLKTKKEQVDSIFSARREMWDATDTQDYSDWGLGGSWDSSY